MKPRALVAAGLLLLGVIASPAVAQANGGGPAAFELQSGVKEPSFDRLVSPEGRLLASSPTGIDARTSGELRSAGGLVAWERAGAELHLRAYDAAGLLVSSRWYRDGKLVAEESRERDERGETVRYLEPTAERLSIERYERGFLISRETFVQGVATGRSGFAYDEAGRLVREHRSPAGGPAVELSYRYAQDGFLERDEEWRGGVLFLARSYAPDGSRVEERYDGGRLAVRTRFEGGRRVAEEFYQGGVLVRERRF
jgi:hypothetical protein